MQVGCKLACIVPPSIAELFVTCHKQVEPRCECCWSNHPGSFSFEIYSVPRADRVRSGLELGDLGGEQGPLPGPRMMKSAYAGTRTTRNATTFLSQHSSEA